MKLEFMLEDLATQDVDDTVLASYLQENAAEFRAETEVSFQQVFLDPETRPQLQADAEGLLTRLNADADPGALGDPTLTPLSFRRARESEIARQFGKEFARDIAQLAPRDWSGPLYSPFGAHLVRIEDRVDARLPALGEIRERVLREYQADQRQQQKDLVYERLREGYEISVDPLAGTNAAAAESTAQQ